MQYAVVWLDAREAHVIHFDEAQDERRHIEACGNKAAYCRQIEEAIADAESVLLTGDAAATQAFAACVQRDSPALRARIFGIIPLPWSGERALLAFARRSLEQHGLSHDPELIL